MAGPSRRSWWALRGAGAGLILASLAYVALPIWLPTRWLAHRIELQLAQQLDRPVHIRRLRVEWTSGVVIDGLSIQEKPGALNSELVHVRSLRCSLSPLVTLVTGRVDALEITAPEIWLVSDAEGNLNISRLPKGQQTRLLSLIYDVRDAVCHVWTPRTRQTFRINAIQCRLEPQHALLDLNGWAMIDPSSPAQDSPRLSFDARITVPKLRPGRDVSLGGAISIEWTHLALTDLPLVLIPRLPVEQVGGTSSGTVSIETRSDLTIDFSEHMAMHGVRLMWAGLEQPAQVPDALLQCAGRFDPNTDSLTLMNLACATSAVQIAGAGHDQRALSIDPHGVTRLDVSLQGEVINWEELRRQWPQIGLLADRAGLQMSGNAGFNIQLVRRDNEGRAAVDIDATRSEWQVATADGVVFRAGTGFTKRMVWNGTGDFRDGHFHSEAELQCGQATLLTTSRGSFDPSEPLFDSLLSPNEASLSTMAVTLEVKAPQVEELIEFFPLAARCPDLASWRGPIHGKLDMVPSVDASRIDFDLVAGAPSCLGWSDMFRKDPGQLLAVRGGLTVPHARHGLIQDIRLTAQYAHGSTALAQQQARVRYQLSSIRELTGEIDSTFGIEMDRLEDLAPLFPRWERARNTSKMRSLSGSLHLAATCRITRAINEFRARGKLEIDADDLAVECPPQWHKRVSDPLAIRLVGHTQSVGGRREDWLGLSVNQPNAALELTFDHSDSESSPPADSVQHVMLDVRASDLVACLNAFPSLAARAAPLQLAGSAQANVNIVLLDGRPHADIVLNAEQAGFTIPGDSAMFKPVGMPADLRVQLEATEGPPAPMRVHLRSAQAHLADLSLDESAGELSLAIAPGAPSCTLVAMLQRLVEQPPRVQAGFLRLHGQAACSERNDQLGPVFSRWRQRYGLDGGIDWELEVSGNGESAHILGSLDGTALSCRIPTGRPGAPTFCKTAGLPARLSLEASTLHEADRTLQRVDVSGGFDLAGNRINADGSLWVTNLTSVPKIGDWNASVDVDVNRDHPLTGFLPSADLPALNGHGSISLSLEGHDAKSEIVSGQVLLDKIGLAAPGSELQLDGRVGWDADRVNVPALRWQWGASRGEVAGLLTRHDQDIAGHLLLTTQHLDVADLQQRVLLMMSRSEGHAATAPASSQSPRDVLAFLSRCDLDVHGNVDVLTATLPPGIRVSADAVSYDMGIHRGPVQLTFSSVVDGGQVQGQVETRTDVADPTMRLTYTATRIKPGPLVDEYLRRSFPGMKATGPVTLIDESVQKLLPAPGEANWPTGTGELIIDGGSMEGRAAPRAVTRIFPGLNLAHFDYSYMHSWFTKEANGRIHHQMIYQGRFYNVYMNGFSDPTGFQYEVGIDFLADFNSKYWADSGQGRIPLFVKTGRILEDGSLADEEVRYLPPQRMLDVLLVKNNPVFTAYHAVRKRVRAEK